MGAIKNWAIFGVISIHFRAFFKAKVHNGNVFGDHKISRFFFVFFLGGGGVGMPDIPIFRVGVNSGCMKKN